MARLIDAEKLNFHCNYNGDCSGDVSHCKECDNYVLDYRDIQEYPTAYDVDKVVEQLEDRKRLMMETLKISEADIDRGRIYGMDKAIEIVKGGGLHG